MNMKKFSNFIKEKTNESKVNETNITFEEIVEILISVIDDGYDIVIFGANGNSYNTNYIKEGDYSDAHFRLKRWEGSKNCFSFSVNFHKGINYEELTKLLSDFNSEIGRFNDKGYYLENVNIDTNNELDYYQVNSVRFYMSN